MEATATVSSSTINLVKTIMGAGMLAIPYAFRNDGVLVGSLLTLLAAVTSGLGLFILGKCSKTLINPRNSSFFTLCMLTYPSLSPLFDLAMIVQCFGVGLSYLILIGDLCPGLFGGDRNYWIWGSAIIIVPLCSLKKMDSLKYSSILGLFALAYLSLLVLSTFAYDVIITDNYKSYRGEVSWWKVYDSKGLMSTFSIIIFAFTGSMNLFSIINELQDNSLKNITAIINRSISIASAIFLAVGITGYLTFGKNTLGNIILNYDPDSVWVHIGKLCLGSMVILSFPLLFHPCRIAINNLVVWLEINFKREVTNTEQEPVNPNTAASPIVLSVQDEENESLATTDSVGVPDAVVRDEDPPVNDIHHTPFPNSRFYIITATLLALMYLIALNINSFALVLALVGATGSTSISFTLPGLFGYKLIGTDSLAIGKVIPPRDRFYKRCSVFLVWYGIGIMVLSLYITLAYGTES